ncbi:MAG TPA: glycosyltransferase family A protein [Methylomirabilota bacterium]|nr:glycosyltransferase family A protein [Methylomirabilota bacterium]
MAVLIPAYNAERFLGEALESVREQTVQPAEVVVVNDGSTDRTGAVARAGGALVLEQCNMGVAAARNTAIHATSQPWVAFLDADDVWEPRKLEAQWAALQARPDVGAVFTDFTEFDADGPIGGPFLSRKTHYWSVKRVEVGPGMVCCDRESLCQQFLEGNFIAPSTMLVRRDLLLQVGLFDPALSHFEDRDCWLRLLAVSTMAVVERPLVWSRIHASNLTHDQLRANVAGILLTERILANSAKYPPATTERYRRARSIWHLNAGRFAEAQGNLRQARQYYLEAWRFGGGLRPFALAGLSWLPDPVRSMTRAVRDQLLPSHRGFRF